MSNALTHWFVSAKADGSNATRVRASAWNHEHVFGGGALGSLLYYDSATSDKANWLAAAAAGNVLLSAGAAAPAWGKVDLGAHITGTLPWANVTKTSGTLVELYGSAVATRALTGRADYGTASSQYVLAVIGDSWATQGYLTGPIGAALTNRYGGTMRGVGWIGCGITAPPTGTSCTKVGTWVDRTHGVGTQGLDFTDTTSTDTATPARATIVAVAPTLVLHYLVQPGGGDFTYAVDGGGATTVHTDGTLADATVSLTGLSVASHSLVVTVTVAGTAGVTLLGVDAKQTTNGARILNLGSSGMDSAGALHATAAVWQAQLTAAAPNAVLILLGVNDTSANVAPATYGANIQGLITRIQAALPLADIVLVAPPEIGVAGLTYTMAQYADQLRALAVTNGGAMIDLGRAFGTYAATNSLGLWTNTTHPNTAGGQVLAGLIVDSLIGHAGLDGLVGIRGLRSVGVGPGVLAAMTIGSDNAAIGTSALAALTSGVGNTAMGGSALIAGTSGGYNVAVGFEALKTDTTAGSNVAVGYRALYSTNAAGCTAVGTQALYSATGASNTAVGYQAAVLTTSGTINTAIGREALYTNATGSANVALGYCAGKYETGSYAFYVDAIDRTNTAGDKAGAIIYGTMNATPASQTLRFNASVSLLGALTLPGGLVTHTANDSAGAGFRYCIVPNA